MNQFGGDSDMRLEEDPLFNPKYEEQFILRLPPHVAAKMKNEAIASTVEFHWIGAFDSVLAFCSHCSR